MANQILEGDIIMTEFNTTTNDRVKAQSIQKQYINREENKMEQLIRLDSKVKIPGRITASILGVVGALTMGAGMSLIMVWENMMSGLVLGIPGMILALLAYPIYQLVTNSRKKKYSEEIIKLSDNLIKN